MGSGVGNRLEVWCGGYKLDSKKNVLQGGRPSVILSTRKSPLTPWEWKGLGAGGGSAGTSTTQKRRGRATGKGEALSTEGELSVLSREEGGRPGAANEPLPKFSVRTGLLPEGGPF